MTTYALDANALIANMKPKASTLEEAIDYATACALTSWTRQALNGDLRIGDFVTVGPHTFRLDDVEKAEGVCGWEPTGSTGDYVSAALDCTDDSVILAIENDPHFYEVKAGRLACYEPD